jgi:hypothetical protein
VRRFASFSIVFALLTPGLADLAQADGLYVGHGRRSQPPWSARFNVSGGLHGASDPFGSYDYYARGYHWYDFGGYGSAGLEIHTGYGNSVELYGLYRSVEDTDRFVELPFSGNPDNVLQRFEIDAWSFGVTLRHYETRGRGGGYVGVGGGFVQADGRLREVVNGVSTLDFDTSDEGGEIHFLVGFEGRFAPNVMVGLELGYRHAFLDDPEDFSGAVIGLRMGFLVGRR